MKKVKNKVEIKIPDGYHRSGCGWTFNDANEKSAVILDSITGETGIAREVFLEEVDSRENDRCPDGIVAIETLQGKIVYRNYTGLKFIDPEKEIEKLERRLKQMRGVGGLLKKENLLRVRKERLELMRKVKEMGYCGLLGKVCHQMPAGGFEPCNDCSVFTPPVTGAGGGRVGIHIGNTCGGPGDGEGSFVIHVEEEIKNRRR